MYFIYLAFKLLFSSLFLVTYFLNFKIKKILHRYVINCVLCIVIDYTLFYPVSNQSLKKTLTIFSCCSFFSFLFALSTSIASVFLSFLLSIASCLALLRSFVSSPLLRSRSESFNMKPR